MTCPCPGCGGYAAWKAEQAAEQASNARDFELWLAAREDSQDRTYAEAIAARQADRRVRQVGNRTVVG